MKRRSTRCLTVTIHMATMAWCFFAAEGNAAITQTPQESTAPIASSEKQEIASLGQEVNAPAQTTAPAAPASTKPTEKPLPRGLDKIVELAKSGVAVETQVAFVESIAVAYKLSADEIIRLQSHGVSSEVITALIRHGIEVRAQMLEEWKERQSQPAQQADSAQAAPNYAAPSYYAPAQPDYEAPQHVYPTATAYTYASYSSPGFLVIGTSHHNSGYRGTYPYSSYPGSYISFPRYSSPAVHISGPVAYAPRYFRDSFYFRR